MSLQDKLNEIRLQFEANVPLETREIMNKAGIDLANSGIMDQVLNTGDQAPSFTIPDQKGNNLSSGDLLARGPLVVTFYRGVW
jgi:hypothetical protein